MASRNEAAVQIMEHLCIHDGNGGHGYSQAGRAGSGVESVEIDGTTYFFAGRDRDCSSAVISAYEAAEVNCGGATYTGNMRQCMCATGNFEWMPMSYIAQRGDIYLNEYGRGMSAGSNGHTAMCISAVPDMLAEFSRPEGSGVNGQQGDQTGWESHIRAYYDCPWDGILRYVGEGAATPPPGGQLPDLRYRVKTAQAGWLPEMVNWNDYGHGEDDFAGNIDQPITYVAMGLSCGYYQVRTEASGWLPPVNQYNISDEVNGCAGDGSPITGIRCWRDLTNPNAGAWMVGYQVANVGGVWLPEMHDLYDHSSSDDYAGNGGRIDRFRARYMTAHG